MTPSQLPDRPNLEQLKKQAKSLLHAAQARDAAALAPLRRAARVREQTADELGALGLALHDAQSVIAREHGFPSWNALREEVEARTLSFDAARRRVPPLRDRRRVRPRRAPARALSGHRVGHRCTRRWSSATPRRSRRGLRDHPELATQPGGPQNWEPLLYVCHTCMHVERAVARWTGWSRLRASSAPSAPIRTPNTTGTGTRSFRGRRSGARSARSGICRSPKCCSTPARIRPTASRCTSPAAAAISTRSTCCTATAST